MSEQAFLSMSAQVAAWLRTQPAWYSLALHKASLGEPSPEDIENLAAAACEEAGFAIGIGDASGLESFQDSDIAALDASGREVVLRSVTAVADVNALTNGASLLFAPEGLTVVYGENGSGKSGFGRLIRNTCTSRTGASPILPNAFEPDGRPEAIYEAIVDGFAMSFAWADGDAYPHFPEIAFFDAACAAAEIEGKGNEVLFVPPVLVVLNHLSALITAVSSRLREYASQLPAALPDAAVPASFASMPAIAALLGSDDPVEVRVQLERMRLSVDDEVRKRTLQHLIDSDPSIEIPKLEARAGRLTSLRNTLAGLYKVCGPEFENQRETAMRELEIADEAAEAARSSIACASALDGVGTDAWKVLWEAARSYSDAVAHPGEHFPALAHDAVCPLCQQPLTEDARTRMRSFDEYVKGAAESALAEKTAVLAALDKSFTDAVSAAIREEACVPILEDEQTRADLSELLEGLRDVAVVPDMAARMRLLAMTKHAGVAVRAEIDALGERIRALRAQEQPGVLESLKQEQLSLEAREWAVANGSAIVADAEARQLKGRIAVVQKQCSTRSVSKLVGDLSRTEVVEKLQARFAKERIALEVTTQPIYLKARTKSGRECQEFAIEGALSKAPSGQVLSEGEQRIAALAGFFALLDMEPNRSTAVLDDPVSSLDRRWTDAVASRIVEEAARRPVVVFTHDPYFCTCLISDAKNASVRLACRTILRSGQLAGVVRDGLDWEGADTDERIAALEGETALLRAKLQNEEFEDDGTFELTMRELYGRLRCAWERAVEEVLLAKVVERSDLPVRMQSLEMLTDIVPEDVDAVKRGMAKCTLVIEDPDLVPGVPELQTDIGKLSAWVTSIAARRL